MPSAPEPEPKPLLLNTEQRACLSAPLRREVFETLLALREASINELAAYINRSSKSLYYHVRPLEAVGLVYIKEYRLVGKRKEAVYCPTATRLLIEEDATENEEEEQKVQKAFLRHLEREMRTAESVAVRRVLVWLTPEVQSVLEEKFAEIERFLRQNDQPIEGERTALTVILTTTQRKGSKETQP